MGENSAIEWTNHTFNPWVGCTKVSPGCANCYAEREMDKRLHFVEWGPQGQRRRTSGSNWQQPRRWDERCRRLGIRERVFCASLADVFEGRSDLDEHRADLWKLIEETPNLDWLLLTKRPENIERSIPIRWLQFPTGMPTNIWFGTSVENQETANTRITDLLSAPGRRFFLSIEPLLGLIHLTFKHCPEHDFHSGMCLGPCSSARRIQWVIVGGESGPDARPMHPDCVRSIRDQCVRDGVPFFFKQWGEWLPFSQRRDTIEVSIAISSAVRRGDQTYFGCRIEQGPQGLRTGFTSGVVPESIYRVGKKLSGRLLDGREWNELPVGLQQAEVHHE